MCAGVKIYKFKKEKMQLNMLADSITRYLCYELRYNLKIDFSSSSKFLLSKQNLKCTI